MENTIDYTCWKLQAEDRRARQEAHEAGFPTTGIVFASQLSPEQLSRYEDAARKQWRDPRWKEEHWEIVYENKYWPIQPGSEDDQV